MTLKDDGPTRTSPHRIGNRIDPGTHPASRPKDAASLILVDRADGTVRVLLGKRAGRHTFMPNTYVFPGGRRDHADSRARIAHDLDDRVVAKLMLRVPPATSLVRARGLAVTALRETQEETGLTVGGSNPSIAGHDLSCLRYVARAVTPPGRSRRYDTRFFACFADDAGITDQEAAESEELTDLRWVPLERLPDLPLPAITATILEHLRNELSDDPALSAGRPVPFFHVRRGVFARDIL